MYRQIFTKNFNVQVEKNEKISRNVPKMKNINWKKEDIYLINSQNKHLKKKTQIKILKLFENFSSPFEDSTQILHNI